MPHSTLSRLGLVAPLGAVGLLGGLLVAAGCGGGASRSPDARADDGGMTASNPRTLWLAPLGRDETRVSLVDTEPPPF